MNINKFKTCINQHQSHIKNLNASDTAHCNHPVNTGHKLIDGDFKESDNFKIHFYL